MHPDISPDAPLVITIYCTSSYAYAIKAQVPLVVAAVQYAGIDFSHVQVVIAGDDSKEIKVASERYEKTGFKIRRLVVADTKNNTPGDNHEAESNMSIARMQLAAWDEARRMNAAFVWSLESDILPTAKTLRCMIDALCFDRGWYSIAMCTYPNIEFLGGHGSPRNWILPNVYPDERELTDEIKAALEKKKERELELSTKGGHPTDEEIAGWKNLEEQVKNCKHGNVWELNAKGWRRRGWLSSAYPGIGIGAILPTEWVGLGCTLLDRRALDYANFVGYDGGGTQDLWLCWKAWNPSGIRMCVITHALCSHVKWRRKGEPENDINNEPDAGKEKKPAGKKPDERELVIYHAFHQMGGDTHGHLRVEVKPWTEHSAF